MNCPNRSKKKRLGPGGGSPLCKGTLRMIVMVPVEVPIVRGALNGQSPYDPRACTSTYIQKHGFRVSFDTLAAAFKAGNFSGRRIGCGKCDWSFNRLESVGLNPTGKKQPKSAEHPPQESSSATSVTAPRRPPPKFGSR